MDQDGQPVCAASCVRSNDKTGSRCFEGTTNSPKRGHEWRHNSGQHVEAQQDSSTRRVENLGQLHNLALQNDSHQR